MTSYRGAEAPQRREELVTNAQNLATWFRIRRDIGAARDRAVAAYKQQHPHEKKVPSVHIVFPYKRREDDPQTTLTEWTVPVDDVLEVAKKRIGTYGANLRIKRERNQYGFDMPVEDRHGKELAQRVESRVKREPAGTFFPVEAAVMATPEYLKRQTTELNVSPIDAAYWLTLWVKYMERLLIKKAQQRRGDTSVTIFINAPANIYDYGFTWKKNKRFSFDWQTIQVFASVINNIEQQLLTESPEDYQILQDRIDRYYDAMGDEGEQQPEGLFPQWLYFLPDIIDVRFLPPGR